MIKLKTNRKQFNLIQFSYISSLLNSVKFSADKRRELLQGFSLFLNNLFLEHFNFIYSLKHINLKIKENIKYNKFVT